jgi:hypothetical protein
LALAEQIKECLACETHFKQSDAILAGVTIAYSEQYCSKACELEFEQYLQEETERADELNIVREQITETEIRKIVNNFHLKLTKEKQDEN